MGDVLKQRIKQARFESPVQEAMLNVMVAASHLRDMVERVVEPFGITQPQYNVLRILRGVHPDGHPRRDIAARMIDRAPDVTRIIDRLEDKRLVSRARTGTDRRHSITRITPQGLRLLDEIQAPLGEMMNELRSRLAARDCRELSSLCERLYAEAK